MIDILESIGCKVDFNDHVLVIDSSNLTSNEIAQKCNISSRRVRILCGEGRVEGAIQKGILWLIPSNTQKPQELRRGRKKQDDI